MRFNFNLMGSLISLGRRFDPYRNYHLNNLTLIGGTECIGAVSRCGLAIFAVSQSPRGESLAVEAIEVHHFGPGRDEVFSELLVRIRGRLDLRQSPQLRVRAEKEVHPGCGPFERIRPAVAPFVYTLRTRGRLPARVHVEEVHEELVR